MIKLLIKIFFSLSLLFSFNTKAQIITQNEFGFNGGVLYYGRPAVDVGIMFARVIANEKFAVGNYNAFLNSEITYDNARLVFGPKIGFEYNYMIFTGRISNVLYLADNVNQYDNRIILEGGGTIFGMLNLCYGYSIPTTSFEMTNINRHRISIRINLFPFYTRHQ